MSIRDTPLPLLTADDIRDAVARRVREDRTLDFKQSFGQCGWPAELARDVIAFANAEGGTLIYGIREHAGEAVAITPLTGNIDQLTREIDMVLRENVDERIPNVTHRAVEIDGGFAYVVRVPSSPLAPHMTARLREEGGRFYVRATGGNELMTARQVKESVSRGERAVERARELIEERVTTRRQETRVARDAGGWLAPKSLDQVILHLVPLFPPPVPWDARDQATMEKIRRVRPFAGEEPFEKHRFTQAGIIAELPYKRGVAFLRGGALEWIEGDLLQSRDAYSNQSAQFLIAPLLEDGIMNAFEDAHVLSQQGLFPAPYLAALHVLDVQGSRLVRCRDPRPRDLGGTALGDADVTCGPYIFSSSEEAWTTVRHLADDVWQAYGYPHSYNFTDDHRLRYAPDGSCQEVLRPLPFVR